MEIIPSFNNYFTTSCHRRMCLLFPSNALFFAIDIAAWKSQCIDTEGVGYIPRGIPVRKFLNRSVSLLANSRAINYDSMVYRSGDKGLFRRFPATPSPPKVKT